MSDTIEDIQIDISQDDEQDTFAHYADRDDVMEAFVYGVAVMALCGKIWIPTRDGSGHKICQTCKEIYSQLS